MARTYQLYQNGSAFLFRADPRTKLIGVLVAFVLSVLFTSPLVLGPILIATIVIDLAGGVPAKQLFRLLQGLVLLAGISIVMWPLFFKTGQVVFVWKSIRFTDLGISFGVAMGCRILIMVLSSTTLMLCTTQQDLLLGLRRLGLPYKACFAFATSFRFLPTMVGVMETIIEAQKARGLNLDRGGVIKRLKNYAAILAPMIIESIRTAQQLALSVEVRGFGARPHRTTLKQLQFSYGDRVAIGSLTTVLVAAVCLRIIGYGVIPT